MCTRFLSKAFWALGAGALTGVLLSLAFASLPSCGSVREWRAVTFTYKEGSVPMLPLPATSAVALPDGEIFITYSGKPWLAALSLDRITTSLGKSAPAVEGEILSMMPSGEEPERFLGISYPKVTSCKGHVLFLLSKNWAAEVPSQDKVRWLSLDLRRVPEVEELRCLACDSEGRAFYGVGRTRDSLMLLTGHRRAASSVLFERFGHEPLRVSNLGNASLAVLNREVVVLTSELIATESEIPREQFKPGPVELLIYHNSGNLENSFRVEHSGTTLADVGFGNSLQLVGGKLFAKVGSRIWRYDDGGFEEVFRDRKLLDFVVVITDKGMLLVKAPSKGYWVATEDLLGGDH